MLLLTERFQGKSFEEVRFEGVHRSRFVGLMSSRSLYAGFLQVYCRTLDLIIATSARRRVFVSLHNRLPILHRNVHLWSLAPKYLRRIMHISRTMTRSTQGSIIVDCPSLPLNATFAWHLRHGNIGQATCIVSPCSSSLTTRYISPVEA